MSILAPSQAMMDSDGDGAVTFAEMTTALKECWAINQAKDRPEAIDVLVKASLTLRKDKVHVIVGGKCTN